MHCTIHFYNNYTTTTCRCLNHFIIYLSLCNDLKVRLNGKIIALNDNVLIINHNDLYTILGATQIIEIKIPLFLFAQNHYNLFISHYNYQKLQSSHAVKLLILQIINEYHYNNTVKTTLLFDILQLLNTEAYVTHNKIYKPIICSTSNSLNNVASYINHYSLETITSHYLAQKLYFSTSYISLLFSRKLTVNFKYYLTSLKIALSIPELLLTNSSITSIAYFFGFKSYYNYLTHFKQNLNTTPHAYRQQYTHLPNCPNIYINVSPTEFQNRHTH
jgi:AraC-like DNA-binding protein